MAVDKLVDSTQLDTDLTSVANAIRAKGGTQGQLAFPSGFVTAIQNIPSVGGAGAISIVDTPDAGGGDVRTITAIYISEATISDISQLANGVKAVGADGTIYTGNVPSKSSSDLTASGATVTAPAGLYAQAASKSVATGTAGTPTATKGAVSNHSVSVTPSVTNTTGYIEGSTKTGTPVTVSASELVSGSETKTANGTYDVTNLASLVVAVPIVTYYTGSSAPSSSLGSNGDIYLQTGS